MSDDVVVEQGEITSDDKLWALLSYILSPLVPIIVLLLEDKKNRPFIKFNAVQALIWGVLEIILSWAICVTPIMFVISIYWGVKAFQGEKITIPVISDFVSKQGWA